MYGACLLELVQEIHELMFEQVWDHGPALCSVEHVLVRMILIGRAKRTVTQLREAGEKKKKKKIAYE